MVRVERRRLALHVQLEREPCRSETKQLRSLTSRYSTSQLCRWPAHHAAIEVVRFSARQTTETAACHTNWSRRGRQPSVLRSPSGRASAYGLHGGRGTGGS